MIGVLGGGGGTLYSVSFSNLKCFVVIRAAFASASHLEPTGATSTPFKTPGDDGEDIELSNLDPENTDFDPDNVPLLTDFMTEIEKETVVDKTIN